MKLSIKLFFGLFLVISLLTACKHVDIQASAITIFDQQSNLLGKIESEEALLAFHSSWKEKYKVIVKKLPEFNYRLAIPTKDEQVDVWEYSKQGYVKLVNDPQHIIYSVDLPIVNNAID